MPRIGIKKDLFDHKKTDPNWPKGLLNRPRSVKTDPDLLKQTQLEAVGVRIFSSGKISHWDFIAKLVYILFSVDRHIYLLKPRKLNKLI